MPATMRPRSGARSSARKSRVIRALSPAPDATCCRPLPPPQSPLMKKRVAQYLLSTECPMCRGKRLNRAALSVKFAGLDIAEISRLPLKRLAQLLGPFSAEGKAGTKGGRRSIPKRLLSSQRIAQDLTSRLSVLLDLGLGYLSLERSTPTLSPGELQRLRLATQVRSNLFGVVYVLDEPSAGLHPVRYRSAAAGAGSPEGVGQFVVRRRARTRRHPACRLDRRCRAWRRRTRRPRALQRSTGGIEADRAIADAASPFSGSCAIRDDAACADRMAAAARRDAQ